MSDKPTLLGNWGDRTQPRIGIMLHFDGSASDAGAIAWLRDDPRAKVSYNWIVTDDGGQVTIAPQDARAWHAGVCRPSDSRLTYRDANSAFYGIAVAATSGQTVTIRQYNTVVNLCAALMKHHGWRDPWRIVGHDTECWPRGRKVDPTGPDPNHPVLDVEAVRRDVVARRWLSTAS